MFAPRQGGYDVFTAPLLEDSVKPTTTQASQVWILDPQAHAYDQCVAELERAGLRVVSHATVDGLVAAAQDPTAPLPAVVVVEASLVEGLLAAGPVASARSALLKQVPFLIVGDTERVDLVRGGAHGQRRETVRRPLNANDVVQRCTRLAQVPEPGQGERIRFNLTQLRVATEGHDEVALTPREFQILRVIHDGENRTAARAALFAEVWSGVKVCNKVLDVHVSKLRKKLVPLGIGITFVKPNGYRLEYGDERSTGSGAAETAPPLSAAGQD